jgi:hypothetical protein
MLETPLLRVSLTCHKTCCLHVWDPNCKPVSRPRAQGMFSVTAMGTSNLTKRDLLDSHCINNANQQIKNMENNARKLGLQINKKNEIYDGGKEKHIKIKK